MIFRSERGRRGVLKGLALTGIAGLLPSLWESGLAQTALPPTPACADDDDPTPTQTEGPFFTPNSPERINLREDGMPGPRMVLTGFVLTRSCTPLPGALVELWHADNGGRYDNEGFRLRGHQFTGVDGNYRFETIVPGLYPGRTRHFHVKYQAADQPVLTTQLYFPGEPANTRDSIFQPELLMRMTAAPEITGRFDAVLDLA
jgi:protocatechuate 3,4-dioxygenase beta subunit